MKNGFVFENIFNFSFVDILSEGQVIAGGVKSKRVNQKESETRLPRQHERLLSKRKYVNFSVGCNAQSIGCFTVIKDRKCAFTLAETLITLVIIGIVAAVTVPIIMNKNGEIELKTRFKKSYSTMVKAFDKMNFDNGQVYECYYGNGQNYRVSKSECSKMYNNFAKQMNVIKYCEKHPLQNGCIPNYDVSKDYWAQYANWALVEPPAWVLGDGSIMIGYGRAAYWPIFLVDINGMKGPNRPGYDVFSYYVQENQHSEIKIKPSGYVYSTSNGVKRSSEWMIKEMIK